MSEKDYLFRGNLEELDPDVHDLIRHETARQAQTLILIPSESTIPAAVREALGSAFHNIYAEGYPLDETRWMQQSEILDYNARLSEYRRVADNRYYKGTEYADVIEALARRRVAELFATEHASADELYVNVQPLSGAPANNAAYSALLNVGDTVLGMDLLAGGHLTHGSPVNRSGINYNIVSYGVDPETEKLDYEEIRRLAVTHQPKMIIGGYTSYPYAPDWQKLREIADEVGAYLMADVAHVAGMVAAGAYPSPVGIADVVNFTTHKTLGGPRGAVSITHLPAVAKKIDRAVFPGEQGGPHVHQIVALAVALRLASSGQFRDLQHQTVKNAVRLSDKLTERGIRVAYGGTDTHLLLVDCKSIVGEDGTTLSGDIAARVLDLAGIVCNRNTIPGDPSAFRASGVRIGTPWVTQRGFHEAEIERLGDLIADLLQACVPYSVTGKTRWLPRAKVDFDTLQRVKCDVRDLAASVGIDTDAKADGYPHFFYMEADSDNSWKTLQIKGDDAADFLHTALTSDVHALQPGESQQTRLLEPDGREMAVGVLERTDDAYLLHVGKQPNRVTVWLRSLSDGFALFDLNDPRAEIAGPVDVVVVGNTSEKGNWKDDAVGYMPNKTYFIGMNGDHYAGPKGDDLPAFEWTEPEEGTLKTTLLHELHIEHGARLGGFAGYAMPLWYSSVTEEHNAVRSAAGLFDVTHMGVFDVRGDGACSFLNTVMSNDISMLHVGRSQYTYMLDENGVPLDDLLVYRLGEDHYLLVVNASNNDKNWKWLNAVKNREVRIDPALAWRTAEGTESVELRDLRAAASGADRRVDIALQGPASKNALLALGGSDADLATVDNLNWADVARVTLGGFDMIVSRTGYTGERIAYELFVHPNDVVQVVEALVARGVTLCGLAARDSLRTEAGLPLYGHELAGPLNLNPSDAGFFNFVKLTKPYFVGKAGFVQHETERDAKVVRFVLESKGARPPHQGDPIVDKRGRVVGVVTSCSVDTDGYQLGQAYIKEDYAKEGTEIAVFAGSSRSKNGKALSDVTIGDRVPLPEPATVLSRFPKKKK